MKVQKFRSGLPEPRTENLLARDDLRIDYFMAGRVPSRAVVFTFTPWNHGVVDGLGYGGRFLLRAGYDVVAYKLAVDNWYQSVPRESFARIHECLAPANYERRMAYGSSMGAYAAIQFSAALRCDAVLALSPRTHTERVLDADFEESARRIGFRYSIGPDCIAAGCQYFLVYDSRDSDKIHVDRLRELIPDRQLRTAAIPWVGHPVDAYLSDVGLLKPLVQQVFGRGTLEGLALRKDRASSQAYFANLSLLLAGRSKDRLALAMIDRALALRPDEADFHGHQSALLERLGRIDEALAGARTAARLRPEDPTFAALASTLLEQLGDCEGALEAVREALARAPTVAAYHAQAARLLARTGQPAGALAAFRTAVRLDGNDVSVRAELSYLLTELGDLPNALAQIDAAIAGTAGVAEFHCHRGAFLELLGQLNDAIGALRAAVALEPANVELRAYLQHLLAQR